MPEMCNSYPKGSKLYAWHKAQPKASIALRLERHSFRYLLSRLFILFPTSAARFILHIIEIFTLSYFFKLEQVLLLTLIRIVTIIVPSAWWGVMEPIRQSLRDCYNQRNTPLFTSIVKIHLRRTQIACILYGVIFSALSLLAYIYEQNILLSIWVAVMGFRGIIMIWVRSYQAIAYSISRIYVPVLLFITLEICLLIAAVGLSNLIGGSALFVSILSMTIIQAYILYKETYKKLQGLNLDRYVVWNFKWQKSRVAISGEANQKQAILAAAILRLHTIIPLKLILLFTWFSPFISAGTPIYLFILMPWLTLPLFFPALLHHDFLYNLSIKRQQYYAITARNGRILVCISTIAIGILLQAISNVTNFSDISLLLTSFAIGTSGILLVDGYAYFHQKTYRPIIIIAIFWYISNLCALLLLSDIHVFLFTITIINIGIFIFSRLYEPARMMSQYRWVHYDIWKSNIYRASHQPTLVSIRTCETWTTPKRDNWLNQIMANIPTAHGGIYSKKYFVISIYDKNISQQKVRRLMLKHGAGTIEDIKFFSSTDTASSISQMEEYMNTNYLTKVTFCNNSPHSL